MSEDNASTDINIPALVGRYGYQLWEVGGILTWFLFKITEIYLTKKNEVYKIHNYGCTSRDDGITRELKMTVGGYFSLIPSSSALFPG